MDEQQPIDVATGVLDSPTAAPNRRRLQAILGGVAIAVVVIGVIVAVLANGGSRTTPVSASQVRYTSDTGRITMVAPRTWDDQTPEVRTFLEHTTPATRIHQVELIAVVDGEGFEIAVTLVGDADDRLDEVMEAIDTLTVSDR
jgi:hypothetical protein